MKFPAAALLILAVAGLAHGQVYTFPIEQVADAPWPEAKPGAAPLGPEIGMLDLLEEETITNGELVIPLGDKSVLKVRFEEYLSQEPDLTDVKALGSESPGVSPEWH